MLIVFNIPTPPKRDPYETSQTQESCKEPQASVDLFAKEDNNFQPGQTTKIEDSEKASQDMPHRVMQDDDDAIEPTQEPTASTSTTTQRHQRTSDGDEANDDFYYKSRLYGAQKKKKLTRITLVQEDEAKVVEWLRANPFLYDRKHKEYKYIDKKRRMHEVMGQSLTHPITGAQMRRWIESVRSRYGRLTDQRSKTGTSQYSDRERWILEKFSFFAGHIIRNKARSSQNFDVPPSASEADLLSHADDQDDEGDGDDDDRAPSESPPRKRHRSSKESANSDMNRVLDCLNKFLSVVETLHGAVDTVRNHERDVRMLSNYMYEELCKMSPHIKLSAKKAILNILAEHIQLQLNHEQRQRH